MHRHRIAIKPFRRTAPNRNHRHIRRLRQFCRVVPAQAFFRFKQRVSSSFQAIEQRDDLLRISIHLRAAAAADNELFGVFANHGHRFHILQRERAVIFQQDHPVRRRCAGKRRMRRRIKRVSGFLALKNRRFHDNLQNAPHIFIQRLFAEFPFFYGIQHDLIRRRRIAERAAGHNQVIARRKRDNRVFHRKPV